MKYDVIVIGSGMSGLIGAAKAISRGKSTLVITKGQGVLPLTSGCIDLLGYQHGNAEVYASNPYEEICKLAALNPEHPYAKVLDIFVESIEFFKEIMTASGCILAGNLNENQKVLTALGTERISALVPPSMYLAQKHKINKIIAVGIKNYPDFFPQMFLDNLTETSFPETKKIPIMLDLGFKETIRSGFLSSLLENESVFCKITEDLKALLSEQGIKRNDSFDETLLFVFPAVLGRRPDHRIWERLREALLAQVIEVPGLPPSIPGQRLHKALTENLRQRGAEFRYNTEVTDFTSDEAGITSIIARDSSDTEYGIKAGSVILATGSFIGGGLAAKKETVLEPIFNLPVITPDLQGQDAHFQSLEGQAFLSSGLETDEYLRPLGGFKNLYAAGSILAHCNYADEKNGLGIAIATGYKAGSLA